MKYERTGVILFTEKYAELRRFIFAGVAFAVYMSLAPQSAAEEESNSPSLLALGAGYYDFAKNDNTAVDFRLEYRSDLELWKLQPWLGLEVTTDRAVYSAGGLFVDLALDSHWVLTPSAGVGAYYDGDGKNLGSKVAFRLQAELSY